MKRPILAALAFAAAAAAPATASAASIELNDAGVIAYKAKSGEVNALKMNGTVGGGFDLRMAFFEYSSRLTPGPGCESRLPVICGAFDRPSPSTSRSAIGATWRTSTASPSAWRSTPVAATTTSWPAAFDATAEGGSGNDTIRLAANNGTRANGGSGRDRVTGGLGALAAILDGGGGNDLFVPDGSQFNDAKGASGDDQLVNLKGARSPSPAATATTCCSSPSRRPPGSTAARTTTSSQPAGSATVEAGAGNDVVAVQGGTGAGAHRRLRLRLDVVWLDDADAGRATAS